MKKNPRDDDPVEEAGDESFPASDPPSWTASGTGPVEQTEPVEEGPSDPAAKKQPSDDEQKTAHGATCRPDNGFEKGSVDK
jgi:hypothetical protein